MNPIKKSAKDSEFKRLLADQIVSISYHTKLTKEDLIKNETTQISIQNR